MYRGWIPLAHVPWVLTVSASEQNKSNINSVYRGGIVWKTDPLGERKM